MQGSDPELDPNELILPAVNGTLGILKSALGSSSVKRVVVTSSVTAAWQPVHKYTPITYSEDDWNDFSIKLVEEKGKDAPPFLKYAASKTLAEKAAWAFVKEQNAKFDLVTILPGHIWGRIISETTADIQGSNRTLLNPLKSAALANKTPQSAKAEWYPVDIRDVSKHHVEALLVPAAGGERLLSIASTVSTQDTINLINQNPIEGIIVPQSESLGDWKPEVEISREKIQRILGIEFYPMAETVRETVIAATEVGWKQ